MPIYDPGLVYVPFTDATGVRIPVGTPILNGGNSATGVRGIATTTCLGASRISAERAPRRNRGCDRSLEGESGSRSPQRSAERAKIAGSRWIGTTTDCYHQDSLKTSSASSPNFGVKAKPHALHVTMRPRYRTLEFASQPCTSNVDSRCPEYRSLRVSVGANRPPHIVACRTIYHLMISWTPPLEEGDSGGR